MAHSPVQKTSLSKLGQAQRLWCVIEDNKLYAYQLITRKTRWPIRQFKKTSLSKLGQAQKLWCVIEDNKLYAYQQLFTQPCSEKWPFDKGVSAHSPSLLGHPLILVVQQVQCHPGMAKKKNYLTNLKNCTKISYMASWMLHSRWIPTDPLPTILYDARRRNFIFFRVHAPFLTAL